MAALTITTIKGPHPGVVVANDLDAPFTALPSAGIDHTIKLTGREILLVRNTDVGPQTFTLKSVADSFERTQDITAYSLGAGEFLAFSFFRDLVGWANSTQNVTVQGSSVLLEYLVLSF